MKSTKGEQRMSALMVIAIEEITVRIVQAINLIIF